MKIAISSLTLTAIIALPLSAFADSLPERKAGLWEVSVTSDAGEPQTMKQCVDASTDAEMMKMGTDMAKSMGGGCSKNEFKRTASGFETNSECKVQGSTMISKGVFTGDFSSSYSGDVTTSYTPPFFGQSKSKVTIAAKHVGPCDASMKPGDMVMGNGMKMNATKSLQQAQDLAKMAGDDGLSNAMAGADLSDEQLAAIKNAMKQGMRNAGR